MEWEFTPQQVVKGEIDYGLDAFRHDLRQEVALNIPDLGNEQLEPVFRLAYDLCYWLATGKDYDEFEERFQDLNARDVPARLEGAWQGQCGNAGCHPAAHDHGWGGRRAFRK